MADYATLLRDHALSGPGPRETAFAERVIGRNPLLGRHVPEHRVVLRVISTHARDGSTLQACRSLRRQGFSKLLGRLKLIAEWLSGRVQERGT
jgi:hypothetical protein